MTSLETTENLLTFYQFPHYIWSSVYSTNLIESLNKEIKRQSKKCVYTTLLTVSINLYPFNIINL